MRKRRILAEIIVKRLFREQALGELDAIEMVEEHKASVEALISRANKMWRLKE